ncbi:MAG: hypothetical protein RR053_01030 [Evtepia sp.]
MEVMRDWMIAVTVAAMIIAVADSITPSGSIKKVGRFIGGLVLMLGILQPVMRLDYDTLYCMANDVECIPAWSETAGDQSELLERLIKEEVSAYVLDKAEEMGVRCSVTVCCTQGEVPYPSEVILKGEMTVAQRKDLTEVLEHELNVRVK